MERTEIIGEHARILDSKNKSAIGIEGTIIDETRNMITIRTDRGEKKLVKQHHTFTVTGKAITGQRLLGGPEERLKRWTRR